jgi:hypothetical protein
LDEVIEEIRRLMLNSKTEIASNGKLSRGEPVIAEAK